MSYEVHCKALKPTGHLMHQYNLALGLLHQLSCIHCSSQQTGILDGIRGGTK